ncbi:MAG: hypothetical protein ACM3NF_03020 [Gemmatimonadota bacterium]
MKRLLCSLALAVAGAVMFFGFGLAVAGAGAPPKADTPRPACSPTAADNQAAPAMMGRMKAHLDGMKAAVASLRESERALAATEDPTAFRAAVIAHLKTLDDLQESHLGHMESMMGRMQGPGMDCGKCGKCGCRECAHRDSCPCACGASPQKGPDR